MSEPVTAPASAVTGTTNDGNELLSIGAAASVLGISERSLRYYQQLGLITPCGRTPGGMRRYSEADLARVARIRELQTLLGLNLDEISVVLHNDDRMAEIREAYHDERTGAEQRAELARECLVLQQQLRATVEQKREALDRFLADVDARIGRIRAVLSSDRSDDGSDSSGDGSDDGSDSSSRASSSSSTSN
ncbi:MAG TPA: MerR family transcriptional regulator [Acidimicrobiales bacterium]|nr:MerR family transcriptional regulator [Acidimicrobiales bacterium]